LGSSPFGPNAPRLLDRPFVPLHREWNDTNIVFSQKFMHRHNRVRCTGVLSWWKT